MEHVKLGRKLYIHYGDSIVAIEKLVGVSPEDMGLSKEQPLKLTEIIKNDNGVTEVDLPNLPSEQVYGANVDRYMWQFGFWLTNDESSSNQTEENEYLKKIVNTVDRENDTREKLNLLFRSIEYGNWDVVTQLQKELKEQLTQHEPELVKAEIIAHRRKINKKKRE